MFAAVTSAALVGVEPRPVRVEVYVGGHTPGLCVVGLPDTAVREARDRVRAALASSGFKVPDRRVTVNLAPADLPKAGSAYDLPIALGLIAASGEVPIAVADVVALGELALDGAVRPARGGIAAAVVAAKAGRPCLVPAASAAECALVTGADTRPVSTLAEAVVVALGEPVSSAPAPSGHSEPPPPPDLSVVRGQPTARRALEVSAAGGHHMLMWGPPGGGKTLLAQCLPGILPLLEEDEALEVAQVWSSAGRPDPPRRHPPFRSPHHTASGAALVGGGSGIPTAGELSLAHRGVLFLDELGEFPVHLLDALRQPIEEGSVTIARSGHTVTFPAEVQLIGATNPCPCGHLGDRVLPCRCRPAAVDRYRRRLSGPLLDRFDLRVAVGRPDAVELVGPPGENSATVRSRVEAARRRQRQRGQLNRVMTREKLDALFWEPAAAALLERAVDRGVLSGRGFDRVRRVARTIADLERADIAGEAHVAEALSFRGSW